MTHRKGAAATALRPRVIHRESFSGFPDLAPPKTKTPPRKHSRGISRMPCLHREFEVSIANFKGYAMLQLQRADIDPAVQTKLLFGRMGFTYALFDGDFFMPHKNMGSRVFVIATGYVTGGRIEDLVAFIPGVSKRWWLRTGDGCHLGDPASSLLHCDITRFLRDGAKGFLPLMENNG